LACFFYNRIPEVLFPLFVSVGTFAYYFFLVLTTPPLSDKPCFQPRPSSVGRGLFYVFLRLNSASLGGPGALVCFFKFLGRVPCHVRFQLLVNVAVLVAASFDLWPVGDRMFPLKTFFCLGFLPCPHLPLVWVGLGTPAFRRRLWVFFADFGDFPPHGLAAPVNTPLLPHLSPRPPTPCPVPFKKIQG